MTARSRTGRGDDPAFESADPAFSEPYVDVDEWRETPVRHRYVHGGFRDTETRFSIYLPPAGVVSRAGSSNTSRRCPTASTWPSTSARRAGQDRVLDRQRRLLPRDQRRGVFGGYGADDPTIAAYRANAAAARYSRVVAAEMYGQHRPFGYAYGGSGGGFRTIGSIENTTGVWDGVVPYVIGSPMAIPNMFTVRMHAQRILRDRFEGIVDAVEPGGSGDPSEGL